jgi:hypothetical protein
MRAPHGSPQLLHGGTKMVRIAGSDIPNLSDIVENTFDSIADMFNDNDFDVGEVDTGSDFDGEE